jgi:hypothetical protein
MPFLGEGNGYTVLVFLVTATGDRAHGPGRGICAGAAVRWALEIGKLSPIFRYLRIWSVRSLSPVVWYLSLTARTLWWLKYYRRVALFLALYICLENVTIVA